MGSPGPVRGSRVGEGLASVRVDPQPAERERGRAVEEFAELRSGRRTGPGMRARPGTGRSGIRPSGPGRRGRTPAGARQDGSGRTGVWQRFATNWAIAALKPVTTAFREIQLRSRSDMPGVIQSQGIAFADGRQSRTDFAFGASMATSDRVSEWPENTGRLTVSDGRMVPLRGASSSHYQREGEPVFTAVAEGAEGQWPILSRIVAIPVVGVAREPSPSPQQDFLMLNTSKPPVPPHANGIIRPPVGRARTGRRC